MSDLKSEQGCKENEIDAEEATEVILDDESPNSSEPTEKVNEKDDETTTKAISDLNSKQGCKENENDAEEATEVVVNLESCNISEPTVSNDADKAATEKVLQRHSDIESKVLVHSSQLGQDMETLKNKDELANKIEDEKESADKVETREEQQKAPQSNFVTIFATAIIGNSNCSQVSSVEISALRSILKSKDHLCRNINYVNFRNPQTFRLNTGRYEHSVQVELDVNTANLWESGRSYIFHHLGKDTWSLEDGATISMIRIHQRH